MTGPPKAFVIAVEDGDLISDRGERTVRALVEHPLIDATWSRYDAGERGPDLHVHHEHVDAFYVVDGELEFGVGPDGGSVRAPAGTFVAVPPDVAHSFSNASDSTARWLNFHAPSTGFIAWLRGERDAFDSDGVPASGGRAAADATVTTANAEGELVREAQLEAMELTVDDDFDMAPHQHDGQVDSFFVLEGEVELATGDEYVRAGPRSWLCAPPGAPHGLRNAGAAPARVLYVRAPPP